MCYLYSRTFCYPSPSPNRNANATARQLAQLVEDMAVKAVLLVIYLIVRFARLGSKRSNREP